MVVPNVRNIWDLCELYKDFNDNFKIKIWNQGGRNTMPLYGTLRTIKHMILKQKIKSIKHVLRVFGTLCSIDK
jgi:hypothetical protein